MIRLKFSIELNYDIAPPGSDFIFNIHSAQTPHQIVVTESLATSIYTDPVTHTRFFRLKALPGPLSVRYDATVDLNHFCAQPEQIAEVAIANLPGPVLPYLYPSRYCQSDRLLRLATQEFGHLWQGYSRVQAIRDWVTNRVTFQSNTSNGITTAIDTLVEKVGVCRDFAHLMIALCRAVNIPASFGTGRDAADAAFATIFGGVIGSAPVMQVEAVPNAQGELVLPQHVPYALSTDGQLMRN